ncbi:MAG: ATP-binding protein [Chloroflexi bacterium]|nr:ATP-binding protein [Chloroflexota bacterium]
MRIVELRRRLRTKKETRELDYKETLDVRSKEHQAGLAKDVAAMANTVGGVIIVGVRDKTWEPLGVSSQIEAQLNPEDLDNKLSEYIDPRAEFDVSGFSQRGKRFVAIEVPKSANAPHMMKKEGNFPGPTKGRTLSAFPRGAIFVRHGAKSAPATRRDMERIFGERLEAERRGWMEGVRRVSEAPVGSEVLVQQQLGVRVTSDPNAPEVRAVLDTSRISTVDEELTAAVKLWNTDQEALLSEHQLYRFYATRDNLSLDSERAGFMLRSSLAHYLPGCYWASRLDAQFLKHVLSDVVDAAAHPADRESLKIIFLVGGEFARAHLSNVAASSGHVGAKNLATSLKASYRKAFKDRLHTLTHQESTKIRFRFGNKDTVVGITAALAKKAAAQQLATRIANELATGAARDMNKAALKRLDIGIYARDIKGKSR